MSERYYRKRGRAVVGPRGARPLLAMLLGGAVVGAGWMPSAHAHGNEAEPAPLAGESGSDLASDILVFGRAEAKIGVAHAASEGTVSGSDLLVRPLLRTAELLEAVPGMVAAQHSGSGKANQYFLRGFNLDHGSDFATYIDGVQMNFRSHGHGQGYLDLNGLIPEIIEREDYRKGPYRADGGDFALAGASYMRTIDRLARPWIAAEWGSFGGRKLAAGGTIDGVGPGELTLTGQARRYDGPWQQAEHLRHYAGFAKYALPLNDKTLDLSFHGYRGTWRPTEQIPERIIGSSVCSDVFCSPDPSARGATTRLIANAMLTGQGFSGNVYGQFYNWSMSSNPTYANPDGSSAQITQIDRRWIFGMKGGLERELGEGLRLRLGTENRYDDIGRVGVYASDAGTRVASLGTYRVREASLAGHGELTWNPMAALRLTAGLRGDFYSYDVKALDEEAALLGEGSGTKTLASPKFGFAYRLGDLLEVYGNWGRGFHSNDARGAVTTPSVPLLVSGTGKELGARFQAGKFSVTATYWWLNVGSELRFVGDSNSVEPTGASHRHGYELVAFWQPLPWLAIDGSYTASHSRYDNGEYIPNAFENAGQLGVTVVQGPWRASVRWRHLGASPLIEDNSVRDSGSDIVNLRAARDFGQVEIYGELLNALQSRDKDIAYHYESYIPAFDSAPTEGRLSRIVEPRTVRMGLKFNF